jgi:hypothetical protein
MRVNIFRKCLRVIAVSRRALQSFVIRHLVLGFVSFSVLLAAFFILFFGSGSLAAPDPVAIKTQGPDTVGNAVFTSVLPPATSGTTPVAITASSQGSNAILNSNLTAQAGVTNYVSGIAVTGAGATAPSNVTIQLTGVAVGTIKFTVSVATGATTANQPLVVYFNPPLAASAANTAIGLNVPALGAGNTDSSACIWGFRQ